MGFPSPAQDYVERRISLDELCISTPNATYFMRADENCCEPGIPKGALLVVDSSIAPEHGALVIASPSAEFVVCRLRLHPFPALVAGCGEKILCRLDGEEAVEIFGVITWVLSPQRAG